jgi:hypothetical protein
MGLRFLRIAVVYLVLGAILGLAMGISQQFALTPVHAHLLLLGWASLALAGVVTTSIRPRRSRASRAGTSGCTTSACRRS